MRAAGRNRNLERRTENLELSKKEKITDCADLRELRRGKLKKQVSVLNIPLYT